MKRPRIAAVLALCVCVPVAHAQDQDQDQDLDKDSEASKVEPHDPWNWLILPGVFRLPETGFGGGLLAGLYYTPAPGRKTSNLPLNFAYTQNQQVVLNITPEVYLFNDVLQLRGTFSVAEWPEAYFGIGNRAKKSNRELYTPQWASARFVVQLQVSESLYMGPAFFAVANRVVKTKRGGLLDEERPYGIDDYAFGGGGLSLTIDTRDSTVKSTSGQLLRFEWILAGQARKNQRIFGRGEIDYRFFLPVAPGHTVAFQHWFQFAHGDVPFNQMPTLGDDSLMRSYIAGRYRDLLYGGAQVEYRFPIWWRFTGTVFAGAGEVFEDLDAFSFRRLRWSIGGGPRFTLNDAGVALRIDAAMGADGPDFYIIVNEAF